MPKVGVDQTKEAVLGVMALATLLARRFADGVQVVEDSVAVWDRFRNDKEFQKVLRMAWEGYQQIPAELSDLDLLDGIELSHTVLDCIPELMAAFKDLPQPEPAPEPKPELVSAPELD